MSYVITGLPIEDFRPLFGLSDAELAGRGIQRHTATADHGYACRLTLQDAKTGDTLLLLNFEHQPADTPFRASHAIFVNESAAETARYVDAPAPVLTSRPYISLRAFDAAGMMTDGVVAPGPEVEPAIESMLADPNVAYIHAHYAGRGCYAARIDRA
ncbi:DUF1203 domain-containing protein [Phenylobacterium soli]|uniref:DUF1203 domain-containing protein n=1 Tax=Phenylobacterium soli TaxID=2170551 RepID=A0A328AQE8_9CAUL|nr:DUF1203 domain-containing protein [Phenylobacterium soli]